jgi:hypothetical protein
MAGEMLTDARTGNNRGARIARAVHINGNAVAPMRAAVAIELSLNLGDGRGQAAAA